MRIKSQRDNQKIKIQRLETIVNLVILFVPEKQSSV